MELERDMEEGPPSLTVDALLSSGVQPLGSKAQREPLSWGPRVSTSSMSSLRGPRESGKGETHSELDPAQPCSMPDLHTGAGTSWVHPVAVALPQPTPLPRPRSHSPAHKHSSSCSFSQVLTCSEEARVRDMRKRGAEARKIRRGGRRDKGEACQVGGGGGLDSGPELRQI